MSRARSDTAARTRWRRSVSHGDSNADGAVFAGLTLGLMGLDSLNLQVSLPCRAQS